MITLKNLSASVKGKLNSYPDIGQTYYMVDSNYRTINQGWSRADGTGPLDLYSEQNPGYVFYAPGAQPSGVTYARDQLAIQAAIDEMVDYRGDTLFFTPGSYSIGTTALAFNVPGARYLGPPVKNPRRAAVTITDAIGDNSISSDDNEFAFLRFVPLTAQNWFTNTTGSDGAYFHDYWYDATGVAASTSTEFFLSVSAAKDYLFERGVHQVDAAQGDAFTLVGAHRWYWRDCDFLVVGPTITWATVITFVTTISASCVADNCRFFGAGGANALITNVFTGMAGAGILKAQYCTVDGTAMPTAGNIETGFDATVGIELAECYLTGDATGEGGTLIKLT